MKSSNEACCSADISNEKEDFKSILLKRKLEESKNAKCKVVIRVKSLTFYFNFHRIFFTKIGEKNLNQILMFDSSNSLIWGLVKNIKIEFRITQNKKFCWIKNLKIVGKNLVADLF